VLDVDYSSKAKLLATGHSDNTLRLWDPRSEGTVLLLKITSIDI
jgi:ribosome biogenesis protein YTM1